ncbi:hypothetical protein L3V79_05160 [Thiotrichales bacterium 19S9-12]|nr:hypothetical protein [Thiotrichales bacterium 19S9-11]MCF6811747.1 hypothetical protein [Thiotrichales bacterium 19S9-12]
MIDKELLKKIRNFINDNETDLIKELKKLPEYTNMSDDEIIKSYENKVYMRLAENILNESDYNEFKEFTETDKSTHIQMAVLLFLFKKRCTMDSNDLSRTINDCSPQAIRDIFFKPSNYQELKTKTTSSQLEQQPSVVTQPTISQPKIPQQYQFFVDICGALESFIAQNKEERIAQLKLHGDYSKSNDQEIQKLYTDAVYFELYKDLILDSAKKTTVKSSIQNALTKQDFKNLSVDYNVSLEHFLNIVKEKSSASFYQSFEKSEQFAQLHRKMGVNLERKSEPYHFHEAKEKFGLCNETNLISDMKK